MTRNKEIMINLLKKLLNAGPGFNMEELLSKGPLIIDVRTEKEFRSAHVQGSINIPLDKLLQSISRLDKTKPTITCCASGMRSATAANMLKHHGFTDVHNGGSWVSVQRKFKQ